MVAERISGKKFTTKQKEYIRTEQGYSCLGCGKHLPKERKSPRQKFLEVHHKYPKSWGGDNTFENGVGLCGPKGCHEVFNRLVFQRNILFDDVVGKLGERPLRRYRLLLPFPRFVEKRIVRRIAKVA